MLLIVKTAALVTKVPFQFQIWAKNQSAASMACTSQQRRLFWQKCAMPPSATSRTNCHPPPNRSDQKCQTSGKFSSRLFKDFFLLSVRSVIGEYFEIFENLSIWVYRRKVRVYIIGTVVQYLETFRIHICSLIL